MKNRVKTALQASKVAAAKAANIAVKVNDALPKSRANEIKLSTAGGVVGAIGGATLIGGMGVVALGGGFAIAGAAVVGLVGLAAGNKLGTEIDRWKLARQPNDSSADDPTE
ncbi:hypothetical protein [Rhizobium herbae]